MRKFLLGECNAASRSNCLRVSEPRDPDLRKLLEKEMFTCGAHFEKLKLRTVNEFFLRENRTIASKELYLPVPSSPIENVP